jgi:REP element-mobilizing transposase RayT
MVGYVIETYQDGSHAIAKSDRQPRNWMRGPPTNCRPFQVRRRPTQLERRPATHGGARDGAGRPPISGRRPPVPHRVRSEHKARCPVHVTLRGGAGLPSLRSVRVFDAALPAIRRASNGRFRVLAFSIQTDHLHAIVEADNSRALVAGIRGLAIRVALAVNRALARRGAVWGDRYHARELRTPQETRAAFLYVLQDWKKHLGSTRGIYGRSSGPWFDGWVNAPARPSRSIPVASPRTWLAATGWRERGGGPLGVDEAPARGRSFAR